MLGDFDIDAYTETKFPYVALPLFSFYVVVVTILLLNLLVTIIADTYESIIEDATQIW